MYFISIILYIQNIYNKKPTCMLCKKYPMYLFF